MFELFFKYPVSLFEKGHFVFPDAMAVVAAGSAHCGRRGAAVLARAAQPRMLNSGRAHGHLAARNRHGGLAFVLLWHPALSVATAQTRNRT